MDVTKKVSPIWILILLFAATLAFLLWSLYGPTWWF